jgi:ribosomal protein S18 acetylase RimI-like enzyme
MGLLHVRAWQAAYRSVMPDEYLDGLRAEDRAAMWRRQIESTGGTDLLVVATEGLVVGFAAFGPSDDAEAGTEDRVGELYAINLDPDYWGFGHGRELLRNATTELHGAGFGELVLWVVPTNKRARGLYESEGWVADGATRADDVLGVTVTDMRYRRTRAAHDG